MKQYKRVLGIVLLASMATVFALPVIVHGQSTNKEQDDSINLTTSPLPNALVGKPGEVITTDLKVKNSGKKDQTLKVGLMKFSAFGEDGKPKLSDRGPKDDYFDWVSFSEKQFLLKPGESRTVVMTIAFPKSAAFGYYYAVTFSPASLPVPSETRQAQIQAGTAILVLAEARVQNATRKIELLSFGANKRAYEFLPATFSVRLANTGNVHLIPKGNVLIYSGKKQIGSLPVNVTEGNMLPDSKRVFESAWADGNPVYKTAEKNGATVLKDGKPLQNLKWDIGGLGKIRFGKYTAHLFMTYDNGERDVPLEAYVTFWVIPWRLFFYAAIPLLAIAILIYSNIRLRRRVKKATTHTERRV